jgi:hypothetical protein
MGLGLKSFLPRCLLLLTVHTYVPLTLCSGASSSVLVPGDQRVRLGVLLINLCVSACI